MNSPCITDPSSGSNLIQELRTHASIALSDTLDGETRMRRALQDALTRAKRVGEELSAKMIKAKAKRMDSQRIDINLSKEDDRGISVDFNVCLLPSSVSHLIYEFKPQTHPSAALAPSSFHSKRRSSPESTVSVIHYCRLSFLYLTLFPPAPLLPQLYTFKHIPSYRLGSLNRLPRCCPSLNQPRAMRCQSQLVQYRTPLQLLHRLP
jgi:hypothetical protein